MGLIVAFGWTYALDVSGITKHKLTSAHDDLVTIFAEWIVIVILSIVAFPIERWHASDFGMRWFGWRDVLAMFAALICASILTSIAGRFISFAPSFDPRQLVAVPLALRIVLVLTAGICEEFMYRGFAIEELARFLGNRWVAGLLSLIFFTIAHTGLYGLTAGLIIPFIVGAMLTILYLWRHNLAVCMLMHAIVDGIFVVLIPEIAAPTPPIHSP